MNSAAPQLSLFSAAALAPTPGEDAARERLFLQACGGSAAVAAYDLGPTAVERIAAEIEGAS